MTKSLFLIKRNRFPGLDEAVEMVIAADFYQEARRLASERCGDEGPETWLRAMYSIAKRISSESIYTESQVVVRSLRNG